MRYQVFIVGLLNLLLARLGDFQLLAVIQQQTISLDARNVLQIHQIAAVAADKLFVRQIGFERGNRTALPNLPLGRMENQVMPIRLSIQQIPQAQSNFAAA